MEVPMAIGDGGAFDDGRGKCPWSSDMEILMAIGDRGPHGHCRWRCLWPLETSGHAGTSTRGWQMK